MKDTAMRTLHATYTTFISIQILQHIHLLFHKYHRTPHVVTGSITLTVTKTCAKIACKHLVNIQTSDHFFHSGHEKRFTYNRLSFHMMAKAIFKLHGKFTFTNINLLEQSTSNSRLCSNPSSWQSLFSLHSQTGKRTSTGILWFKGRATLQPLIVYTS